MIASLKVFNLNAGTFKFYLYFFQLLKRERDIFFFREISTRLRLHAGFAPLLMNFRLSANASSTQMSQIPLAINLII